MFGYTHNGEALALCRIKKGPSMFCDGKYKRTDTNTTTSYQRHIRKEHRIIAGLI